MADLNVEGINLSCLIISVVVSFVSVHTMTNHPCVVMLNEMLSLYSSAWFCAWFYWEAHVLFYYFCNKKEQWCVLAENAVFISNISFNIITCLVTHLHTTQWKVNKLKFAYMLNSTCLVTWYVRNEIPRKVFAFLFLEEDRN